MSTHPRFFPLAIAAVTASFAAAGCWSQTGTGSSSGTTGTTSTSTVTPASSPPVLEEADMTESASPDAQGNYDIFGSLTYTCDACGTDVVQTIRVVVPVIARTINIAAGDNQGAAGQSFQFQLPDAPPLASAGPTDYEIILITEGGVQSEPVVETVTLL